MAMANVIRLNQDGLDQLMEAQGVDNFSELGRRLNISRTHIFQLRSRERSVGADFILKAHHEFGVTFPDHVFGLYDFPEK